MGDFNLCLLKSEKPQYSQDFLLALHSSYLLPTIDKPAYVHRMSVSLIDNIFVNNPNQVLISGNIITDVSDHFSQFCIMTSGRVYLIVISKTIRVIAKPRHFVPSSVLTNIYKSLILPYLTYGLVAWGNASKNYLNKIVVLQKRVLRLIYFVDRKERAIPLFVNAKILPITFLYYEAVCQLMFDIHKDSAPSNITKLFTSTSNIHTYNTCSSTSQFFSVKYSRLKMQKKPFRILVSKSGMRCLMDTKICQRNPLKKKQKELFSIF